MPKRDEAERTDLGRLFLDARNDAGLSQAKAVALAELSQTQLSRIEWGASLPTEAEARELATVYGLDTARRERLLRRVKDARTAVVDSRLVIQRGSTPHNTLQLQRQWRRLESESTLVRAYQPAMVLGVLQTAAYAATVMREPEASDLVVDRRRRHQRLLDGPTPRQVLIQTEGSLRFTVGSAAVMAEQLDALIVASQRPHVRLGVIPAKRPVDQVTTVAFHLYAGEEVAAVVGLGVAAATLKDEKDIAHFLELFTAMERLALFGNEARALLRRIADDHRV